MFSKYFSLIAAGLFMAGTAMADAKEIEAGDLKLNVPESWKQEQPRSRMRVAQFGVGKNGELVVFYFGSGQGGTVQANIDRIMMWQAAVNIIKDYPVFGLGPNSGDEMQLYYFQVAETNKYHFQHRASTTVAAIGNNFHGLQVARVDIAQQMFYIVWSIVILF